MDVMDLDAFLGDFLRMKASGRTITIGEKTVSLAGDDAEQIALALEATAFRLKAYRDMGRLNG